MFKKLFFVLLLFSLPVYAQTTTVSATGITDSDPQIWASGTWSATFLPNPQYTNLNTYNIAGVPLNPNLLKYSGALDATGSFTQAGMYDNTRVAPIGSTWSFTFCPKASVQCTTIPNLSISGTTDNITTSVNTFIKAVRFPAVNAAYGYADAEVYPTPSPGGSYFNVTSNTLRIWTGTIWISSGSGGGSNSNAWIDVFGTLNCDPSGVTSCLTSVLNQAATTPNATFMFGGPQGAKYLMTAGGPATLPASITLQFNNGAQIATGTQASSNITSMNHMTALNGAPDYGSAESVSLSGCTSSSTPGLESFTNCPNTFAGPSEVVYLTGLTRVANCYRGCNVTLSTGNTFSIINPAAGTVASGAETGTAIKTSHIVNIDLAVTGATTSIASNVLTINVTNTLPFSGTNTVIGNVMQLFSTTNVPAGIYAISGGSGTSISLICQGCTPVSSHTETGTAYFIPGGIDSLTLSSALTGIGSFTPGFYAPYGGTKAGLTQIVCTGTPSASFDGPYWITTMINNTTLGLLDGRVGIASVTSGSCALPYTLNVLGPVDAPSGQQIVATGSTVQFQAAPAIYVGWYGAKGLAVSADDTLAFQETAFWNPSHHIAIPHLGPGTYGADINAGADYAIHSVQGYGNSQWIDGLMGTTWNDGTSINCLGPGPCFIGRPDTQSFKLSNMLFYGTQCTTSNNIAVIPFLTFMSQDAVIIGGGEARMDTLYSQCFVRNGISLSSAGVFNTNIVGGAQPDYWQAQNISSDANGGYGFSCIGADCNGGNMSGMNDASANLYGGVYDASQYAGTYIQANGQGNTYSFAAGAPSTITSITVTGSGLTASCTVTPYPGGGGSDWIIISSAAGGGIANVNGTWYTGGSSTFNCPGVTGGPATSGSVETADSNSIYVAIQQFSNGLFSNTWTMAGLINTQQVVINPYSESTNGCITGGGTYLGGDIGQFLYQGGGSSNNCNVTYGTGFSGVWLGSANGGLGVYSPEGLFVRSSNTSDIANVILNAPWNGGGTGFGGSMNFIFSTNADENFADWQLGVIPGAKFELIDTVGSDSSIPLEVDPSGGLNRTVLSGPSATGPVYVNPGASTAAASGACTPNGSFTFRGNGHIYFCNAGTWALVI
jgi:hypothetical protein